MTEEFINERRKQLLEFQRSLAGNINAEREEYDELQADQEPKDTAEAGQFAYMAGMAANRGVADQRRLRQIRAALDAVSTETYGICRNCGREMPEQRLEAIPYAAYCIECEKGKERETEEPPDENGFEDPGTSRKGS